MPYLLVIFKLFFIYSKNLIFYVTKVIKDKPPIPPSLAQAVAQNDSISLKEFLNSLKRLFKNRNFLLMFTSYGKF